MMDKHSKKSNHTLKSQNNRFFQKENQSLLDEEDKSLLPLSTSSTATDSNYINRTKSLTSKKKYNIMKAIKYTFITILVILSLCSFVHHIHGTPTIVSASSSEPELSKSKMMIDGMNKPKNEESSLINNTLDNDDDKNDMKNAKKHHPHHPPKKNKRNLIMMISDGFGPASETMTRNYIQKVNNVSVDHQLPLDTILVGSSRTRSSSSLVTDSAAGATAFACGLKSYNAAISVDPYREPCSTVLEAAKFKGLTTGLVVTSRITHATPATFASHVPHRDMEDQIAFHEIGNYTLGRMVDLMFGGGLCYFLPNSTYPSCREDTLNPLEKAKEFGWSVLKDVQEFRRLEDGHENLPLMALFTPDHMSYEIDRENNEEPSLREMVIKALDILTKATETTEHGFFLMIEGSRIDMAAHSNDPATHLHEILAYQDTVEYVKSYVESREDTVMVSVSDHETGGLSVAYQVNETYPQYLWYPEVLQPVKNSSIVIAKHLFNNSLTQDRNYLEKVVINEWLGIQDPSELEIKSLLALNKTVSSYEMDVARMLNVRAQLGWATHGHSAVDVNLYAYGVDAELLKGNHENTYIGHFIVDFLGLDSMSNITNMLRNSTLWDDRDIPRHGDKVTTLIGKPFDEIHFHQGHFKI